MKSGWREHAREVIIEVLKETEGKPEKEIRKALKDAYPFGARQWHPYKIWLDEIKVQRGLRTFGIKNKKPDPNQQKLFNQ